MSKVLQEKNLYGNWTMLAADGSPMCKCSAKRAQWYLKRGIAEQVSDNPPSFKLKFEANGPGHRGSKFYLSERKNHCVVCGSDDDLTKHHIIPILYRRNFPVTLKARTSHDVLLVCETCHHKYETEAWLFKVKIAEEMDAPILNIKLTDEVRAQTSISKKASTLLNVPQLPQARRDVLIAELAEHLGHSPSQEELIKLSQRIRKPRQSDPHGAVIASKLSTTEAVTKFIKRWRHHFVNVMQPQFLPDGWEIDHVIGRP